MDDITTVYFDTCFYIWLGAASDDDATKAIDALNARAVRPVLSRELIAELLRTTGHPENDSNIVERARMFDIDPYVTHTDAHWELLLVQGTQREEIAQSLRAHEPLMSEAEAASWLASEGTETQRRQQMARLGLNEQNAVDWANQQTRTLLGVDAVQLREQANQLSGGGAPDAFAFFQAIMAQQGYDPDAPEIRELFEQLAQHRRLHASVIGDRALAGQIALGESTEGKRREHQNDLRDIGHMEVFLRHRAAMDLLQVDGKQARRVRDSQHELSRLGLHGRVFSAKDLTDAVAAVLELRAKLMGTGGA